MVRGLDRLEVRSAIRRVRAVSEQERPTRLRRETLNPEAVRWENLLGTCRRELEEAAGILERGDVDRPVLDREGPPPVAADVGLANRGHLIRLAGPQIAAVNLSVGQRLAVLRRRN